MRVVHQQVEAIDFDSDADLIAISFFSIGVFLGIESFGQESLKDANKRQNKIEHYKTAVSEIRNSVKVYKRTPLFTFERFYQTRLF